MKKKDLIDRVAEKAEMSKTAASRAIEAIFDAASGAISEAVKAGEHVAIPGFGRFKTKTRAARTGRNPRTGTEIDIPERVVVAFTPGKGLQEALSGGGTGGGTKAGGAKRASGAKGATAKGGGKSGGAKSGSAKSGTAKSGATKSGAAKGK